LGLSDQAKTPWHPVPSLTSPVDRSGFGSVMRLRGHSDKYGPAELLDYMARRLHLCFRECRGFHDVQLWSHGEKRINLLQAHPSGFSVEKTLYLISND
jgi:hypothetical protein